MTLLDPPLNTVGSSQLVMGPRGIGTTALFGLALTAWAFYAMTDVLQPEVDVVGFVFRSCR